MKIVDLQVFPFPKDHIEKFILAIRLMKVKHEDVVCRIFPIPLRIQPQLGILTFMWDP
jgi:hypothetical protein